MNARLDRHGTRFRIRNRISGAYIHLTMFRILEFDTRAEAIAYMQRRSLNRDIYYTEAVL